MKNFTIFLFCIFSPLMLFAQNSKFLIDSLSFNNLNLPQSEIFIQYEYDNEEKLLLTKRETSFSVHEYPQDRKEEISSFSSVDSVLFRKIYINYSDAGLITVKDHYNVENGEEIPDQLDSMFYSDIGQITRNTHYEYYNGIKYLEELKLYEYDNSGNQVLFHLTYMNSLGQVLSEFLEEWNYSDQDLLITKFRQFPIGDNVMSDTIEYYYENNLVDSTFRTTYNTTTQESQGCTYQIFEQQDDLITITGFTAEDCVNYLQTYDILEYAADKERYFSSWDSTLVYNDNILITYVSEIEMWSPSEQNFQWKSSLSLLDSNDEFVVYETTNRWYHLSDLYMSVEELNSKNILSSKVFPNPVNSFGTVSIDLPNSTVDFAYLYNMEGRLIQVMSVKGKKNLYFSAPAEPGLYFIQFLDKKKIEALKPTKFLVK